MSVSVGNNQFISQIYIGGRSASGRAGLGADFELALMRGASAEKLVRQTLARGDDAELMTDARYISERSRFTLRSTAESVR